MRRAVEAWVARNGYWCPGYQRPGHYSADLTAEHDIAIRNGGLGGPLSVLCRGCNAAKSNAERGQGA